MSRRSAKSGLTLIEIMVVVAILGLIASIVGISVVGQYKKAQRDNAVTQIRGLESALKLFRLECGRYPSKAEGLDALVKKPARACHSWRNFLAVPQVPSDPWSQPYEYFEPGEHGQDVEVASRGEDGSLGTQDDLVSWTVHGTLEENG